MLVHGQLKFVSRRNGGQHDSHTRNSYAPLCQFALGVSQVSVQYILCQLDVAWMGLVIAVGIGASGHDVSALDHAASYRATGPQVLAQAPGFRWQRKLMVTAVRMSFGYEGRCTEVASDFQLRFICLVPSHCRMPCQCPASPSSVPSAAQHTDCRQPSNLLHRCDRSSCEQASGTSTTPPALRAPGNPPCTPFARWCAWLHSQKASTRREHLPRGSMQRHEGAGWPSYSYSLCANSLLQLLLLAGWSVAKGVCSHLCCLPLLMTCR